MPESQENKENRVISQIQPPQPKVVQPPLISGQQLPVASGVASPAPEQKQDDEAAILDAFGAPSEDDMLNDFGKDPLDDLEDDHTLISRLRKIRDDVRQKSEAISAQPQSQGMGGVFDPLKKMYQTMAIPSEIVSDELMSSVQSIQAKLGWDDAKTQSVFVNTMLNAAKETPVVAADLAGEMLDPVSLGLMGYGKGVQMAGQSKLGKEVLIPAMDATIDYFAGKLPMWAKKPFTYKYGLPNKQEYIEFAEKRVRGIKEFLTKGSETGHTLYDGLSPRAQVLAKEMMEGKFSGDELERMSLMPGQMLKEFGIEDFSVFSQNIKNARQIMDDTSQIYIEEGLKSGFLNQRAADVISNNKGKYMPRLYEIFENPTLREKIRTGKVNAEKALGIIEDKADFLKNVAKYTDDQVIAFGSLSKKEQDKILSQLGRETAQKGVFTKPVSGFINSIRKRGDLDAAQQAARKVVQTPAYLAAKHIQDAGSAAMNLRFFGEISKNPNWVMKPKGIMGSDWVAMPKDRKFGEISGKWVRKEVAEDIISINTNSTTSNAIYKFFGRANQLWKANKTIFSPSTHARNIISNTILLDLSGVPLHQAPKLLTEALEQVAKKGPIYKEAVQHNLIGSGFANSELQMFLPEKNEFVTKNIAGKVHHGWRKMYETAGGIYAGEEEVFKIAKYIHGTRNGLTPLEAAAEAEKWLFNYNKVSRATELARSNLIYNIPFITFTVKSTPRIAEAALKNPFKLYKYNMFMDSWNSNAAKEIGMSEEDLKYIKSKKGVGILMPSKDKNGEPQWLTLRNILPWAEYHDTVKGVNDGKSDIPSAIKFGGISKTLWEIAMNKDSFTDKEVYTQGSQVPMQIGAKIWKDFAPPLNPIPFWAAYKGNIQSIGYQAQKLADSMYADGFLPEGVAEILVAKKAGYYGAAKSVPYAVLDAFLGLSIQPIQDDVLIRMDVWDLKAGLSDAKKILSKAARDQGIDDKSDAGRAQLLRAEEMMEEQLNRALEQWEKLHP
jgi:hypothetical protein